MITRRHVLSITWAIRSVRPGGAATPLS
jgi:hypothetical protein